MTSANNSQLSGFEIGPILVVGQLPSVCEVLQDLGYVFECFSSGEAALDRLVKGEFVAGLIDFDGLDDALQLGSRLKSSSGDIPLSVVLVSKLAFPGELIHQFGRSCDEFIQCPIDVSELRVRLEALMMRRGQQAELMRANTALRGAQERRSELAALIVHDLRNPLSAILGNVQLMQECCSDEDTIQVQCLDDLNQLSIRVLSMASSLLDVEELEEGLLKTECSLVDVPEFLNGFPKLYETSLSARRLDVDLDVLPGLQGHFDRQLVARIVENLLDNAVRYAPRKGCVLLRSYSEDKDLIIEVGNSGPEIPLEERNRIFDRYYRLEARRAGARESRGLGLYFCRLAAVAHGGGIEALSRPNYPACFVLKIPNCVGAALP